VLGSDDAVLVVGGGAAGHACVTTYREAGGDRPVVLVSADDRPPYFRPFVTKEHLAGSVDAAELALAPPDWYRTNDVEVVLECDVRALDLGARLAASTAGPIRWGRCVLATGSDPAPLPVAGTDERVVTIRSASDAERLVAALDGPVVVVGSGFVGCEAAASLRARGVDVTMVSEEPRPQADRLGDDVGRLVEGWLRDGGTTLLGGRQVEAVDRHGDALVVTIAGGAVVEASLVVVAVGARPRTALAADLGLGDDDGVPVDTTMVTATPDVLAVGDVAAAWHATGGRRLRVEHWGDALAHGRVAGLTLAGEPASWTDPPGFWSTIAGHTLKHVAWGDGYDAVQVVRSAHGMTCWYGRDGVVVGVLTHDHDDDDAVAGTALGERWAFPRPV
jgi:3-phenylpropionate/trans-cinnamate dioxygenase ferredoxin reductase subunit